MPTQPTPSGGNSGAYLGAGAAVLGSLINAGSTIYTNSKNQDQSWAMYNRQKMDELENWNRQNAYNSPEQQMARLTKAGLNPNLVYGNGAVANSTSAPATPHLQPYRAEAPRFDNIPQIVDQYFNVQMKQQQLSNEKQMGNNLAIDALVKTEDAQSKSLANNYMITHGYDYKRNSERSASQLMYEKMLAQNALNAYNFGGDLDSENGIGRIADDSAYSLQKQGLNLLNRLRGSQDKSINVQTDINHIRKDYTKRTMSGELRDMSAKDILQLILQGGSLFK